MTQIRDSRAAILRGVMNRCPSCGEGQLMQGYLKVNPVCAHCQAPLSRYPAADGPAFFTMTVMLLVLIPLFGIIWNVWRPEPATLLAVTGLITTVMTLVLLRLIQGFALGGEWGGAVLIVSEHGRPEHRGFWASWPQAGAPAGQLLANGLLAVMALVQPEEAFQAWGWRIPFLLSAVLVLIGLYVRLAVEESPVFREAQARAAVRAAAGEKDTMPILDVLRLYPREVLTAMGARFAENVSYYIFTIVISTYVTRQLDLPSSFVLGAVLIGAAVHLVTTPMWGAVSDRVGRKPVYLFGAAGVGIWAFVFFFLVDTRNFALTAVAVTVGLVLHGAMYGPQAAFLSELFGTKVRYSGVSIGYQLASVFAGGLAPVIAVALLGATGTGYAIAAYIAASSVLTIIAVASYSETRTRRLDDDTLQRS